MQIKFFTLPVNQSASAEAELNSFLAQHKILSLKEAFVGEGQNSFWAISVTYLESSGGKLQASKASIDYKEVLSESDFVLYSQLRDIRKSLATEQGVPPYILFTNEQLAAFVTHRVASKSKMKTIEGVGESRIEKYAEPFLDVLKLAFAEDL